MSMQDLLSDALTRVRNAQMAKHTFVLLPCSKAIRRVLDVLKREGYIEDYSEVESETQSVHLLKVDLKYYQGEPVIRKITRVSKPGCRVYSSISNLPKAEGGLGMLIVSTSKGVLSDYEARIERVGGEVICEVC